jgi:hypothetical protein
VVNLAIQQVLDQIDFDPETGEILCDSEALFAQLNALEMERKCHIRRKTKTHNHPQIHQQIACIRNPRKSKVSTFC